MKKYSTYYLGLIISFLLFSCYPDGPENSEDYSLMASAFNPEYPFENAQTYLLPDTIIFYKDDGQKDDVDLTDKQKKTFVTTVRENLDIYGWTDNTGIDTTADVLVFVSVISSTFSGSLWDDWFYYHGWGNYKPVDPDGHYSWIPGYSSFLYEYNVGSMLITMVDVDGLEDIPEDPPAVWIGGINGLLNSSLTVNTEPVVNAINKVFELSPILDKN